MVAVAIGGAAVLGAGSSIIASNKASGTAQSTAAGNNGLQSSIYNQNAATLSPYETRGNAAGSAINALTGLDGSSGGGANYSQYVQSNPDLLADWQKNYAGTSSPYADQSAYGQYHYDTFGQTEGRTLPTQESAANQAFDAYKNSTEYTSRLKQGQDSVTAALGGKGLLDSGAAQKSLLNYGQTAASNEFGNYVGILQGQQQAGLSAASAQAGVGQNYANAVSSNNNTAANTTSNAALANAGNINAALGNAVTAYGYDQGVNLGSSYKASR